MDKRLNIASLIHENFGLVMTYAYSYPILNEILESDVGGKWKYLWMSFNDLGEPRADRALLQMAIQLRTLDEIDYGKELGKDWSDMSFGYVSMNDGKTKDLKLRQAMNKIIHASEFHWVFKNPKEPKVVCSVADGQNWITAEINLLSLWSVVGSLML